MSGQKRDTIFVVVSNPLCCNAGMKEVFGFKSQSKRNSKASMEKTEGES